MTPYRTDCDYLANDHVMHLCHVTDDDFHKIDVCYYHGVNTIQKSLFLHFLNKYFMDLSQCCKSRPIKLNTKAATDRQTNTQKQKQFQKYFDKFSLVLSVLVLQY